MLGTKGMSPVPVDVAWGLQAVAFTARDISVPSPNTGVGFLPQYQPSLAAAPASSQVLEMDSGLAGDAPAHCRRAGLDDL